MDTSRTTEPRDREDASPLPAAVPGTGAAARPSPPAHLAIAAAASIALLLWSGTAIANKIALVLAAVILGEAITVMLALAGTVILVGTWLAQRNAA